MDGRTDACYAGREMDAPALATAPVILIIDDDPDVRTILEVLLASNGYAVITAIDGASALELARARPVGLIVIDLHLPTMRGEVFCHQYREHGGGAPIFLVTAAQVDRETVARYGADAYIAKPFHVGQVLQVVERLVGRR
jgi:DNA-binding response OmpR family regulator